MSRLDCACVDMGCPGHRGAPRCLFVAANTLYRVDMDDATGSRMCDNCADDAVGSGVFATEDEIEAGDVDDCPCGGGAFNGHQEDCRVLCDNPIHGTSDEAWAAEGEPLCDRCVHYC